MNWVIFANVMRVACLILSLITAGLVLRVLKDGAYKNKAQLYRFVGLAILAVSLSFISYKALGHHPFWPVLILNIIGVAFSIAGTWPMMARNEKDHVHSE